MLPSQDENGNKIVNLNKELVDLKDRCAGYERVIKILKLDVICMRMLWRCFGRKLYIFMFLKVS
jgi:hypothetical protein